MPHYKDTENKVHFLDSSDCEYLLPEGSVQITEEEAFALLNPPATPEEMRENIKQQIASIEIAEIMPRKTREIQIQVMEYFAATQGVSKEQLYAVNPAYKGMVDVDNQIKALRAQL